MCSSAKHAKVLWRRECVREPSIVDLTSDLECCVARSASTRSFLPQTHTRHRYRINYALPLRKVCPTPTPVSEDRRHDRSVPRPLARSFSLLRNVHLLAPPAERRRAATAWRSGTRRRRRRRRVPDREHLWRRSEARTRSGAQGQRRRPDRARQGRQTRPGHWKGRRNEARHRDPLAQEQVSPPDLFSNPAPPPPRARAALLSLVG